VAINIPKIDQTALNGARFLLSSSSANSFIAPCRYTIVVIGGVLQSEGDRVAGIEYWLIDCRSWLPPRMSTPSSFYLEPANPAQRPAPSPPRFLKRQIYNDASVFKHIDDHAINVSHRQPWAHAWLIILWLSHLVPFGSVMCRAAHLLSASSAILPAYCMWPAYVIIFVRNTKTAKTIWSFYCNLFCNLYVCMTCPRFANSFLSVPGDFFLVALL